MSYNFYFDLYISRSSTEIEAILEHINSTGISLSINIKTWRVANVSSLAQSRSPHCAVACWTHMCLENCSCACGEKKQCYAIYSRARGVVMRVRCVDRAFRERHPKDVRFRRALAERLIITGNFVGNEKFSQRTPTFVVCYDRPSS